MRKLVVLGATGSVGRSTLDVAARHPQRLQIHALTAARDADGLLELCRLHRPSIAALVDEAAAKRLRAALAAENIPCEVLAGASALSEVAGASEADIVMSAIVGAAGLLPTLAAVRAGKQTLIANKEPLVMAGRLLMREALRSGACILPIDSEHNAIFQCLPPQYRCGQPPVGVRKLLLTASGGPFREWSAERIATATPAEAVRHPNWSMGPKISVDSATLMNKGLELMEASVLYGVTDAQLDVVIHPESVIHSLVEYVDGSLLAQLGQPDMRVPIAHALAWPERWESGVGGLDLAALGQFRFASPDLERFPCLGLARAALRAGGHAPNLLNAANEIAVERFLNGQIGLNQIPQMIAACVDAGLGVHANAADDLEAVLAVDAWARDWCRRELQRFSVTTITAVEGARVHA
ncbi:MAG: 1-deoxy-D-xylulose-5-phosphate reductoisomerase [Hydrocarboniphaga sp.]|uniref:1-deoxy-D-xylulose-5-phosphate reductoisomerase n=1 Tax=Hydrocarboniphaga sp. TaxID=2033016 RepID=UPI00261BE7D1|nr:1-deoxy-D-xylulose-5-phosphate reductoisomerase [Hydrocarboniphaga sp.]MDB5968963.1 1-deoxy-D-xylulose-5-phosphate reductoisomerase [Hydrocarboniphaga sp.]